MIKNSQRITTNQHTFISRPSRLLPAIILLAVTAFALFIIVSPSPIPQLISISQTRVGTTIGTESQTKSPHSSDDTACCMVGAVAWTDPSNSRANDNVYATASIPNGASTHYLEDFFFSFSIPENATVVGITLQIKRHASASNCIRDNSVILDTSSGTEGDNRATVNYWGTGDMTVIYGGPQDTWGRHWTPEDITSSTFASRFSAANSCSTAATASVNAISVTVYYSVVESPISGGITVMQSDSRSNMITVTSISVSWCGKES